MYKNDGKINIRNNSRPRWCVFSLNGKLNIRKNRIEFCKSVWEGKKVDDELIHEGVDTKGNLLQWIFDDITENTLHWIGKISKDGGKTWSIQAEFSLNRRE